MPGWLHPALLLALLALPGCGPRSRIELLSFRDPYFPQPYPLRFDTCTSRRAAGGDLHIVAQAAPPAAAVGTDPSYWLHVHVFWKPFPGRTFTDQTCTDATFRLIVQRPGGNALYTGTGYIFPRWQGRTLTAEIQAARLRLDSTTGEPGELLGEGRLAGTLVAPEDPHATVEQVRRMDTLAAQR